VVRSAEVVACTLSSAGGDLLSLVKGPGSDPSMLFQAIMIDEVHPVTHDVLCFTPWGQQGTLVNRVGSHPSAVWFQLYQRGNAHV